MPLLLRKILWIALGLLIVNPPDGAAQDDLSPIYFRYFPSSKIKNTQNTAIPNAKIQISQLVIRGGVPLRLSTKSQLLAGIRYDVLQFEYTNLLNMGPDRLHLIRLDLALIHQFNPVWALNAILSPGFASDFKSSLDRDDGRFQGTLLIEKRYGSSFALGLGASASTDFGRPLILPVLRATWAKSRLFRMKLIIPNTFDFRFLPGSPVEFGLLASVSGNQYNLSQTDTKVEYSVLTVGPLVNARFGKSPIGISVDGGVSLVRRFKFNVPTTPNDFSLERGGFFRARLMLHIL